MRALGTGLAAFALGLILTLAAEVVGRRAGLVARPAADRWHRRTVPVTGGLAIVLATLGPMLAVVPADRPLLLLLAVASVVMAGVGFVDDVRPLSPQLKLLAQVLLAGALMQAGFRLRLTGFPLADVFITLFWFVAITNAFNLLDHMDGLSATIALVAAGFRLLFFAWEDDTTGVRVTAAFAGAVAGFLVRNVPPARIFMGDAGSLFLGFFLAGLSLTAVDAPYSRGVVAVLFVPVLLLLIPIFDTAFVTITRVLAGRSPAVGGRDHTSHRLVAIGLGEREAVGFLALIAAASGGVAALSYQAEWSQAVAVLAVLLLGMVLLGIYLSRVRVLTRSEAPERGAVLPLLADFQYKRQVATLAGDVALIVLAYYLAHILRHEHDFATVQRSLFASLPIVLLVQLATLAAFGVYRGVWQYTGIADLQRIVKAATVGCMASVAVLFVVAPLPAGGSRTVFVLDWLLLVVLLAGSRLSFRMLHELLRVESPEFRRVLIYGAGDGGERVAREVLGNPGLARVVVGFIDDDAGKHRTHIHGVPVFGGVDQIEPLVRDRGVRELIISSPKIQGPGLAAAAEVCQRLAVPVLRASFRFE